jgi:hypothetical protein
MLCKLYRTLYLGHLRLKRRTPLCQHTSAWLQHATHSRLKQRTPSCQHTSAWSQHLVQFLRVRPHSHSGLHLPQTSDQRAARYAVIDRATRGRLEKRAPVKHAPGIGRMANVEDIY